MLISIFGGTGLIGTEFTQLALERGHRVRLFSRRTEIPSIWKNNPSIEFVSCLLPTAAQLEGSEIVVNMVGEPIAGVRWTNERKQLIETSRVEFTRGLVARVLEMKKPPQVFLQASAVGYYGMSDAVHPAFSESSPAGSDFLAQLCVRWEKQTDPLLAKKIRTLVLRTGIVLSPKGGALQKMLPPFQLGVGGAIASGNQGMSWIHMRDYINSIFFLLGESRAEGIFNLVSPNPVSNSAFSKVLAKTIKRPNLFKVPSFAIQALFGEGSVVVTQGQYVIPSRLLDLGYEFQYQNLDLALRNLLQS